MSLSIKISLTLVLKGPVNNITALVQIMTWCRPCHKPLSQPIMTNLPMHIYITQPEWVEILLSSSQKWLDFSTAIFLHFKTAAKRCITFHDVWYNVTSLYYHDSCICPGNKILTDHQRLLYYLWLWVTMNHIMQNTSRYSYKIEESGKYYDTTQRFHLYHYNDSRLV